MNKFTKRFLIVSLATLSGLASATTRTNKTHLQPRPAGVNLAMEKTTWGTQINKPIMKEDKMFGGSIQATAFYEGSTNKNGLGRYFGFNNLSYLSVGGADSTVDGRIDRRHLIHRPISPAYLGDADLTAKFNLTFSHNQAGVRFDYYQDLDHVVEGLYFHINAPIVWSQTRSSLNICEDTEQKVMFGIAPEDAASNSVADYFCCGITQTGEAKQEPLEYAKICGNESKTSIADIDLKLGWNFWETAKHHAGINIGAIIPTSPSAEGKYLFEPLAGGNGGHWGLGAGFDMKVRAWAERDQTLELQLVCNYRYLFESSDRRTLGLQAPTDALAKNWGHYFLVGTKGQQGVQPAANILTQKVNVKAGSQVNLLAGAVYKKRNFSADLGYELFGRETEMLTKREKLAKETYALAGADYDATNNFAVADGHAAKLEDVTIQEAQDGNEFAVYLNDDNVVTSVAETPSPVTHKIYAGLGYTFEEWKTPLMLGLGGDFEFASQDKAIQQWGIWGKVGLTF